MSGAVRERRELLPLMKGYARLATLSEDGRARDAHAAFLSLVGLGARREVSAVPREPPRSRAGALRWGTMRRIDVLALRGGARDVAKFEDLTEERADALVAELRGYGLRASLGEPIRKRFNVAVTGPSAGVRHVSVYASRSNVHEQVAEAERDRSPGGTREVGRLLGYPPCCTERFLKAARSERAAAEGVNEAAIRATDAAPAPLPWETNPLSEMSPVGFTACSHHCPRALAFARRVLAAVRELDPPGHEVVVRALSRPVLFFRYPVFFVLDGAADPDGIGVRYARAAANDDGVLRGPWLAAWAEDELGRALAAGNRVRLADGALAIARGDGEVARWPLADAGVPRLFAFTRPGG